MILPALADEIKKWFPNFLKNSFVASANNFNKANAVETPYAVITPLQSDVEKHPTLRNVSQDFIIDQTFRIEFYLNVKPLKNKKGQETPFWAYVGYEEEITQVLYRNIANFYINNNKELFFLGHECFLSDSFLILSYNFKQRYCIISINNEEECLISQIKIDNIQIEEKNE